MRARAGRFVKRPYGGSVGRMVFIKIVGEGLAPPVQGRFTTKGKEE